MKTRSKPPPRPLSQDEQSFLEWLYTTHQAHMVAYTRRFLRLYGIMSNDLPEDIVQDVFVIAAEKIGKLTQSPEPTGWLFQTAKNLIRNRIRQLRQEDPYPLPPDIEAKVPGVEQLLEERELLCELSGPPNRPEDLELLYWVYAEDHTYAEAAAREAISISACKMRISRAKTRLRWLASLQRPDF